MATSKRNSTIPVDDKTPGRSIANPRNSEGQDSRNGGSRAKSSLTKDQELEERLRAESLGQHAPGKSRVSTLPTWPPKLSEKRLDFLTKQATTWALSHSFVLVPEVKDAPTVDIRAIPTVVTRAQPAPLALFPTPFPRRLYQQANSLQNILNSLYMRVSLDWPFLDRVIGESVVHVDEFQQWLYHFWKKTRDETFASRQLGIFRSDYLLHQGEKGKPLELKQVEFNTIAASFGALSQRANELHRYLTSSTAGYWGVEPLLQDMRNYASPKSLHGIAESLAHAFRSYGESNAACVILFVVQPGERNVFDQRLLEYELQSRYGIRVERRTFYELQDKTRPIGIERMQDRLFLPTDTDKQGFCEVAVVYYRAGYSPDDMLIRNAWEAREIIERSRAIKCPSLAMQLAGAKKVQQVLSEPGVLEDFLLGENRPDTGFGAGRGLLTDAEVQRVRDTWMGMWPMDESPMGQEGYKLATTEAERFVLKPQREGGGNNIYRHDIPPHLQHLATKSTPPGAPKPQEQYILMELINPPLGLHNWLLKGGEAKPRKTEVVSELGIYGSILYMDGKVQFNKKIGSLLRTKGKDSDEGGVAIGISSIDSPLLIEEDYTDVKMESQESEPEEEFDPILGC